MRPTRAVGALLPLALALSVGLTGCNPDKTAQKATGSESPSTATTLPTDLPTDVPTDVPSDVPSGLPTELPTALPTSLPTDAPTAVPSQAGGALDGCAVVTPALIGSTFGGASAGSPLGQPSSFGDPDAKDCYYVGGDFTIVIQATTRADADLPESSYSYAGLPGSAAIKGADRGWVYTFPGQDGQDTIVSGIILVKGQHGVNLSITVQGHPYGNAELQKLAAAMLGVP